MQEILFYRNSIERVRQYGENVYITRISVDYIIIPVPIYVLNTLSLCVVYIEKPYYNIFMGWSAAMHTDDGVWHVY